MALVVMVPTTPGDSELNGSWLLQEGQRPHRLTTLVSTLLDRFYLDSTQPLPSQVVLASFDRLSRSDARPLQYNGAHDTPTFPVSTLSYIGKTL